MPKDGVAGRAWYRRNPADLRSDPVVAGMAPMQRMRYGDALDSSWLTSTPGVATEDEWRRWMCYSKLEWEQAREAHLPAFRVEGDRWVQKRLHEEYLYATQRSRQAEAAAGRRWGTNGDADAMLTHSGSNAVAMREHSVSNAEVRVEREEEPKIEPRPPAGDRSPTPVSLSGHVAGTSGTPKAPRKTASKDWVESFADVFWPAYPRQVGKGAAQFSWLRLGAGRGDDPESEKAFFNAIMDGLDRWKDAHKHDEPEFIPHPATWLNQRRWEDETP